MRNKIWKEVVDGIDKNGHFLVNIFIVECFLSVKFTYGPPDQVDICFFIMKNVTFVRERVINF